VGKLFILYKLRKVIIKLTLGNNIVKNFKILEKEGIKIVNEKTIIIKEKTLIKEFVVLTVYKND
jgi:hypothetical protein